MDQRKEAMEQIRIIEAVFNSGTKMIGSPRRFYISGGACLVAGVLQVLIKLGELGWMGPLLSSSLVVLISFGALIYTFRLGKSPVESEEAARLEKHYAILHPLIKQSLGMIRAIGVAGLGLSAVWIGHIGQVGALWLVLFGLMMSVWTRFLHKRLVQFSYVLIAGGLIIAGIDELKIAIDWLLMAALFYVGIWFILAAALVAKYQRQ